MEMTNMEQIRTELETHQREKDDLIRKLERQGIIKATWEDSQYIGYTDQTGAIFPDEEEIFKYYG